MILSNVSGLVIKLSTNSCFSERSISLGLTEEVSMNILGLKSLCSSDNKSRNYQSFILGMLMSRKMISGKMERNIKVDNF